MKFHAVYNADDVFETIKNLNIFNYCESTKQEHVVFESNIKYMNLIFPIASLLHTKMKEHYFQVEELFYDNFAVELWNKRVNLESNNKQKQMKQKFEIEIESCDFNSIGSGLFNFPVISCVVYFHKGDGINDSNIVIKHGNDVRSIDVWSQKTMILFDNELKYIAEPSSFIDENNDCHRKVLLFHVKQKV
jgi:hypothetical protein